jgi:hypothetical protein
VAKWFEGRQKGLSRPDPDMVRKTCHATRPPTASVPAVFTLPLKGGGEDIRSPSQPARRENDLAADCDDTRMKAAQRRAAGGQSNQ